MTSSRTIKPGMASQILTAATSRSSLVSAAEVTLNKDTSAMMPFTKAWASLSWTAGMLDEATRATAEFCRWWAL